uniref:Uncharacterized protein n=1 Tax=Mycena chlorophos TaxID=658473 RepID=A0ABQ0LWP7_MYCCL|nr:predicted protein [Mycena chlorophos]
MGDALPLAVAVGASGPRREHPKLTLSIGFQSAPLPLPASSSQAQSSIGPAFQFHSSSWANLLATLYRCPWTMPTLAELSPKTTRRLEFCCKPASRRVPRILSNSPSSNLDRRRKLTCSQAGPLKLKTALRASHGGGQRSGNVPDSDARRM